MADPSLTDPSLDLAARRVIGAYLAELEDRLGGPPAALAAILAELEDGLWAATATHQASGLPPKEAAGAAVAEFGDPGIVVAGFSPELATATGRRVGLGLLASGPLVGTSWLLVAATSWRWAGREPPAALGLVAGLVGLVLVVAVPAAIVAVAVSGRPSRWVPAGLQVGATAAAIAASACIAGDLVLLTGMLAATVLAGGIAWPAGLVAAGASGVRLNLAGRAARRCLAARTTLT
ncbi:MAG TPA: permease prefix domain 1-containing protein [Actinomycetes bacterium]|nr:permease prefix domain 1-containing protein [Actinomycetes bacterium]